MNSTTKDLPTTAPPTRRMVHDTFVLFLDVLMIPLLRDSTSLEICQSGSIEEGVETYLMALSSELGVFSSSAGAFPR